MKSVLSRKYGKIVKVSSVEGFGAWLRDKETPKEGWAYYGDYIRFTKGNKRSLY